MRAIAKRRHEVDAAEDRWHGVMHPEDGVDSTLRVSLLGRYTEGQEMSSSKVDEDAPASAGCGIMVVPSWSGNTVSMPPRVAGLVVQLGDHMDSTPRVSLPGKRTMEQDFSSSKVNRDAPATARRGIVVVPALRGGTKVAARARSSCDCSRVEGRGRGVLSLSGCTEILAAPNPESEEGQLAVAVAEGGEGQRSPCVREQLLLREQKPSFIEVLTLVVGLCHYGTQAQWPSQTVPPRPYRPLHHHILGL